VIVGFPGETEADFRETCRVACEWGSRRFISFRIVRARGPRQRCCPKAFPPGIMEERRIRLRERKKRSRRVSSQLCSVVDWKCSWKGRTRKGQAAYRELRVGMCRCRFRGWHRRCCGRSCRCGRCGSRTVWILGEREPELEAASYDRRWALPMADGGAESRIS
jgi:hypothetical protein